jgi:hypothetical protein
MNTCSGYMLPDQKRRSATPQAAGTNQMCGCWTNIWTAEKDGDKQIMQQ